MSSFTRKRAVHPGFNFFFIFLMCFIPAVPAISADHDQGRPPALVQVASVERKSVREQISLVGTVEPMFRSIVATEVPGIVEGYPIREGDFVQKGQLLLRLKATDLQLRIVTAEARRDQIQANLLFAQKEYDRARQLKGSDSIAQKKYEEAFYTYQALSGGLAAGEAEIDQLRYELAQKSVYAPFSGFVAEEHTQIGEWINAGGSVAALLDLQNVRIAVDVPERHAVMISPGSSVDVIVKSLSDAPRTGQVYAVLPEGNAKARTFPVRIDLPNPDFTVRSGMEAMVFFNLTETKNALLVPKDAVVTAGNNRLVYAVFQEKAVPVQVRILGYYDGYAAVEGDLQPGAQVVVRGNERLMPGQSLQLIE